MGSMPPCRCTHFRNVTWRSLDHLLHARLQPHSKLDSAHQAYPPATPPRASAWTWDPLVLDPTSLPLTLNQHLIYIHPSIDLPYLLKQPMPIIPQQVEGLGGLRQLVHGLAHSDAWDDPHPGGSMCARSGVC
jgi:hypothetical protein